MRELSAKPEAKDMEPALFASPVSSRKAPAFREKEERRNERDLPGGQGEGCGACSVRVSRPPRGKRELSAKRRSGGAREFSAEPEARDAEPALFASPVPLAESGSFPRRGGAAERESFRQSRKQGMRSLLYSRPPSPRGKRELSAKRRSGGMRELSAKPEARDAEPALFASLVPSRKAGDFREKEERRNERVFGGAGSEGCGACSDVIRPVSSPSERRRPD